MVSVPLDADDFRKVSLFSKVVFEVIAYHGSYLFKDTLGNARGYWVKFDNAETVSITEIRFSQSLHAVDRCNPEEQAEMMTLVIRAFFSIFQHMNLPARHQKQTSTAELNERNSFFGSMPGGELIRNGLADLDRGIFTAPALLVLIGGPRLRLLGVHVPQVNPDSEHALYDLLAEHDTDSAHSRYNALIRTLISFERAAECAAS